MVGQTNLFDDVIKSEERFVIVVQSLEEKWSITKTYIKRVPSLEHDQMENLFTHLKDVFSTEPFSENQSAFTITVYTNLDYVADQVYAYVKRSKGKHEWTHTAK